MWFKLYKKKSALSETKLDQTKDQSYFKTLLKEELVLTSRNICSEIEPEPH